MAKYQFSHFQFYPKSRGLDLISPGLNTPRTTTHEDKYYLPSMLLTYLTPETEPAEILDATPVLSLAQKKSDPFYCISFKRLQKFVSGNHEKPDKYLCTSIKHLFIARHFPNSPLLANKRGDRVLKGCMEKIEPILIDDILLPKTFYCDREEFCKHASLVPTVKFNKLLLIPGWIEDALHYKNASVVFVTEFLHYDCFSEGTSDLINYKTISLLDNLQIRRENVAKNVFGFHYSNALENKSQFPAAWLRNFLVIEFNFWNFDLNAPPFYRQKRTHNLDFKYVLDLKKAATHVFRSKVLVQLLSKAIKNYSDRAVIKEDAPFYYLRNAGEFDGRIYRYFSPENTSHAFICIAFIGTSGTTNRDTVLRLENAQSGQTYSLEMEANHIYMIPDYLDFYIDGNAMRQFLIFNCCAFIKHEIEPFMVKEATVDSFLKNRLRRGFSQKQVYDCYYAVFEQHLEVFGCLCRVAHIYLSAECAFSVTTRVIDSVTSGPLRVLNYIEYNNHLYAAIEDVNKISLNDCLFMLALVYFNRFSVHHSGTYIADRDSVKNRSILKTLDMKEFAYALKDLKVSSIGTDDLCKWGSKKKNQISSVINAVDYPEVLELFNGDPQLGLEYCLFICSAKKSGRNSILCVKDAIEISVPELNIISIPSDYLETSENFILKSGWASVKSNPFNYGFDSQATLPLELPLPMVFADTLEDDI